MQSYAFHELSERAQEAAYARYTQEIDEAIASLPASDRAVEALSEALTCRFTEYGERVA